LLSLKNDIIEVQFDSESGAIRRIMDCHEGKILLDNSLNEVFRLEYDEEQYENTFSDFRYCTKEDGLELRWNIDASVELVANWSLSEKQISTESYIVNSARQKICSVEYPLLDGIVDLSEIYGKDKSLYKNQVAHSYATGLMIEDPLVHFEEGEGFRYMPYPESFSGASMQFFTYYCEATVGLYFAALDGQAHQKWLNFYKYQGKLRASQIYGYEVIGAEKGVAAPWKFVITITSGDGWYEAADLYKQWALLQSWCSGGKLQDRPENQRAGWLLEQTGACTFGINACHDRSLWLERYAEYIKTPIFHVLGPDWSRVEQNYYNSIPGGYHDWFPTRFHSENIKMIRRNGDRFAPFEFDFLVAIDKDESDAICSSLQKWPQKPKSKDEYKFTMLCPICEYTKDLHVKRDTQLLKESNCDSIYYDISANNIMKTCMSDEHGHPVGAGREMTQAYREIYIKTKTILTKEKGNYVPPGTEMMNEVFIDCLDYYQARANAQPCSFLETGIFRNIIKQGKAKLIPMFQYVYSGYAPLRMDGWGKITKEGGDLIYHTIAKTYLWGGLFEINSEYSEMEVIGDSVNSSEEHYCQFKHVGFQFDETIAKYLAKFASLRTGRYNKYLAYGEMKRPPRLESAQVWRSYYHYNSSKHSLEYDDRGTILLESVISANYRLADRELMLLANTTEFIQGVIWREDSLKEESFYDVCVSYITEASISQKMTGKEIKGIKLLPLQIMVIETDIM